MLHIKPIFLLFILMELSNAKSVDLSTRECTNENGCMEMQTINKNHNTTPSPLPEEDVAYYSIINSPVMCKPDERVDYNGRCRTVF